MYLDEECDDIEEVKQKENEVLKYINNQNSYISAINQLINHSPNTDINNKVIVNTDVKLNHYYMKLLMKKFELNIKFVNIYIFKCYNQCSIHIIQQKYHDFLII